MSAPQCRCVVVPIEIDDAPAPPDHLVGPDLGSWSPATSHESTDERHRVWTTSPDGRLRAQVVKP